MCCFTFIFRSLFRSHGQKTIVCHTALAVPEGKSHDNSGYMKLSLFSDLMSSITHRFEQCDDLEAFKNEKTTIANLKKPMADLLVAANTSSVELKRSADQRREKQRQISERCARERERERKCSKTNKDNDERRTTSRTENVQGPIGREGLLQHYDEGERQGQEGCCSSCCFSARRCAF